MSFWNTFAIGFIWGVAACAAVLLTLGYQEWATTTAVQRRSCETDCQCCAPCGCSHCNKKYGVEEASFSYCPCADRHCKCEATECICGAGFACRNTCPCVNKTLPAVAMP